MWVYLSTGMGFEDAGIWSGAGDDGVAFEIGDFDGNGLSEFLRQWSTKTDGYHEGSSADVFFVQDSGTVRGRLSLLDYLGEKLDYWGPKDRLEDRRF